MKKTKDTKPKGLGHSIVQLLLWAIAILYFPVVMSFVAAEKGKTECNSIVTKVSNNNDDILITDKGLEYIVMRQWPNLKGSPLNELNLHEMELAIEQSAVVKRCEVFATPGGVVHFKVTQRKPIMHVFSSNGSYYMDEDAYRIVEQRDMQANTVVVNGFVNNTIDESGLINLCKFIRDNNFWKSQIEQIYVTEKQEFILVPRVGDHVIEFGKADRMEEKFEDLFTLYNKGWNAKEWNLYKKVNLKYKGQIICTKR